MIAWCVHASNAVGKCRGLVKSPGLKVKRLCCMLEHMRSGSNERSWLLRIHRTHSFSFLLHFCDFCVDLDRLQVSHAQQRCVVASRPTQPRCTLQLEMSPTAMQYRSFCSCTLALLLTAVLLYPAITTASTHSNNWAVLVDTSRYWFNYRHIANTLSIYTTIKRYGEHNTAHFALFKIFCDTGSTAGLASLIVTSC